MAHRNSWFTYSKWWFSIANVAVKGAGCAMAMGKRLELLAQVAQVTQVAHDR